nr:AmmeMemoRadiSam system protein A [Methylomonas rhizoryzae]
MWLNDDEQQFLLKLARASIEHGIETGRPLSVDPAALPARLSEKMASFVTLERLGQLRGCIGMLEAVRPLAIDVAENAFAAAFLDSRFPPITPTEMQNVDLHISVLSAAVPIAAESENALLQQLRPGEDGVILTEGRRRATYLPVVWHQLPAPKDFIEQLKTKAGLPKHYWSDSIRFFRYSTQTF